MQLDRTRIVIRERGLLETLDLALHIMREFWGPIVLTSLMAIVPLAILNYFLVGWMSPDQFDETTWGIRFLWHMTLLIYLEAQLATIFTVAYLGPAVFLEERTIAAVVLDVLRYIPHLLLSQGLLRGVLLVWLLYACLDRTSQVTGGLEILLMFFVFVLLCLATLLRAVRPYVDEIILLEKNPVRSTRAGEVTIGQRSAHLHGPYSGDLIIRWIGSASIALFLSFAMIVTVVTLVGHLTSDWPFRTVMDPIFEFQMNLSWFKLQVIYPACLWMVVVFIGVVRFLSYLDLRIRHEGWEVELLMRAEALRLVPQSS
jgi:hypothetical protein